MTVSISSTKMTRRTKGKSTYCRCTFYAIRPKEREHKKSNVNVTVLPLLTILGSAIKLVEGNLK